MIEAVKENLCINKIVGSKIFEITVEGDLIIPDVKPDILNEVNMTGNVCVYKKEILEGKIRLDGNVNIYLIYLADAEDKRIRGFNGNIDFTEILDFPEIDNRMVLDENIKIKDMKCEVLNGRKVNIKVTLEIKADIFFNEKRDIIREVNNVSDIQSQMTNVTMNSLVGQNSTKVITKETLKIDSTDQVLEILSMDFNLKNKDTKISYNKVLAKSDLEIRALYLTEERKYKKFRRDSTCYGIYRFSTEFQKKTYVM